MDVRQTGSETPWPQPESSCWLFLRQPNKPLTKRRLCGFSLSCFSIIRTHRFPPLRAEKHSASASCLNCFQTSHSAAGMNKGTNMTGMLRKQEFRLRNAFMEEIWSPHPVFWVHIVLGYLESSLRCFDISWTILSFLKNRNDLEIALEIWFHSSFFLSTRDDFNIKVLQAFVELHEFADLNLVQALRSAEWLTQIIERREDKGNVLWTRTLCGTKK